MKNEKIVNYKDIGEVLYRRNSRARNISIRINSQGIVKVTVPAWCSYHRAEQFVIEKSTWIGTKLLKIKRKKEENLAWSPGDRIYFHGGWIEIVQGYGEEYIVSRTGDLCNIHVPEGFMRSKPEDIENLKDHVAKIGLKEARSKLPGLLKKYADRAGLSFRRVSIRKMKTRWGSCSPGNDISLNSALIFLPEELIEYVCLHELVHTVHKNHSSAFWESLAALLPEAYNCRKMLRDETIIA